MGILFMRKVFLFFFLMVTFIANSMVENFGKSLQFKEDIGVLNVETQIDSQIEKVNSKIVFSMSYASIFGRTLYPSFIYTYAEISNQNNRKEEFKYFVGTIYSNKNFEGRIRIKENKFIKETNIDISVNLGKNEIRIDPLWKFEEFIKMLIPGQIFFSFELIDKKTEKVLANSDIQLSYRSISECVYALKDDEGEILDFYSYFASYVNEDSLFIEDFLKEAGENWKYLNKETEGYIPEFQGWLGYQRGAYYAWVQAFMICYGLYNRGIQYSSITDTSNASSTVFSQNVRFVDNTILNAQANCVDGSVLIASILEKIGIRTSLVIQNTEESSHMFLAFSEEKNSFDTNKLKYIETTAISTGDEKAICPRNIKITPETKFINIREARAKGIKPIQ